MKRPTCFYTHENSLKFEVMSDQRIEWESAIEGTVHVTEQLRCPFSVAQVISSYPSKSIRLYNITYETSFCC